MWRTGIWRKGRWRRDISTPVNVSVTGQTKTGSLEVNTGGAENGLIVATGSARFKGGDVYFETLADCSLAVDENGKLKCE